MSTVILSLLLLFLIAMGLLMGRQVTERFENEHAEACPIITVSPALANLLATPALEEKKAPLNVDTLARDKVVQDAATRPSCPVCPPVPDMSRYIRIDEIPCWNCDVASTFRYPPSDGPA